MALGSVALVLLAGCGSSAEESVEVEDATPTAEVVEEGPLGFPAGESLWLVQPVSSPGSPTAGIVNIADDQVCLATFEPEAVYFTGTVEQTVEGQEFTGTFFSDAGDEDGFGYTVTGGPDGPRTVTNEVDGETFEASWSPTTEAESAGILQENFGESVSPDEIWQSVRGLCP